METVNVARSTRQLRRYSRMLRFWMMRLKPLVHILLSMSFSRTLHSRISWSQLTAARVHSTQSRARESEEIDLHIVLGLGYAMELMLLHSRSQAYIPQDSTLSARRSRCGRCPTAWMSNCVKGYWDKLSAFSSSYLLNSFNVSVHFSLAYANGDAVWAWAWARADGVSRRWCLRLCQPIKQFGCKRTT